MTTPRLITFYIESYFTGTLQAISRITVGFRTVLSLQASLKIVNDYTMNDYTTDLLPYCL